MTITLHDIGKRYNRTWIFKQVNYTFEAGKSYALLGPNGSGKSTLLQIISTYLIPTEGSVEWRPAGAAAAAEVDKVYQYFAASAPYLELVEEFTLEESLNFHGRFKKMILSNDDIIARLGFEQHTQKRVKQLSSGMKQRLKLALSIFSDVPVLLLDEPGTNLDEQGINWYQQQLEQYKAGRLVLIASNRLEEFEMCDQQLQVTQWRP